VVQKFLPEIQKGDKRVLILNGEIVNCCLTRTPKKGSYIGNLAAGGNATIQPLTSYDRQIAQEVAKKLAPLGFFILGLDIIGKHLTEINVTSPTGFKEITKLTDINIGELFYNQVNNMLGKI
jgi:glutathione synthase